MAYPGEKKYVANLEKAQQESMGGIPTLPPAPELPSRYMANDVPRQGGLPPPEVLERQRMAVIQALMGQQGPNAMGMQTGQNMGGLLGFR